MIKYDSEHSIQYNENAENYKQKLEKLKQKINEKTNKTKKVLCFSESLAYLSETMNLDMRIIETDHEQNGLSAETISQTIKYIKDNNIKSIIIDKQTAKNNAETVANETGAKIYVLDAALSGENDANFYINIMEQNLKIVESME